MEVTPRKLDGTQSGSYRSLAFCVICIPCLVLVCRLWWLSTLCDDIPECSAILTVAPENLHLCTSVALGVNLLREIAGWLASCHRARLLARKESPELLTQFLLCVVLCILTGVEVAFAKNSRFAHANLSVDGHPYSAQPIRTLRYIDWVLTVPLLLVLAGHCALRRPLREVFGPATLTVAYIVLSWGATLSRSVSTRAVLVCIIMVSYLISSADMLRWVSNFKQTKATDAVSWHMRVATVLMLIGLFGVYGVVYVSAMLGVITEMTEHLFYTCAGALCKMTMSLIFTSIRAADDNCTLVVSLSQVSTLNLSYMSILRGSFDIVIPCIADVNGSCLLGDARCAGMQELEARLGRPVAGVGLESLLANDTVRERFMAHVRNVLRQVQQSGNPKDESSAKCRNIPVAQVVHCSLASQTGDAQTAVSVAIHISAVAQPDETKAAHVVAAIVFSSMDSEEHAAMLPHAAESQLFQHQGQNDVSKDGDERASESTTLKDTSEGQPSGLAGSGGSESHSQNTSVRKSVPSRATSEVLKRRRVPSDFSTAQTFPSDTCTPFLIPHVSVPYTDSLLNVPSLESLPSVESCCNGDVGAIIGGSDVGSQSSKLTHVGSVHLACRSLLGPLFDKPPPAQYMSRRIEDHMACAAEVVRLEVPTKIAELHHQQSMATWEDRCSDKFISEMLGRSPAPGVAIDETLWTSEVLPRLRGPAPGPKPRTPTRKYHAEELWSEAWRRTYDEDQEEQDSSGSDSDS